MTEPAWVAEIADEGDREAVRAVLGRHRADAARRGWWGMPCWNGLSGEQQTRLVMWGNLPMGYVAEGDCPRGAQVAIETDQDEAPGPRFYCRTCALAYLTPTLLAAARAVADGGDTADGMVEVKWDEMVRLRDALDGLT